MLKTYQLYNVSRNLRESIQLILNDSIVFLRRFMDLIHRFLYLVRRQLIRYLPRLTGVFEVKGLQRLHLRCVVVLHIFE